MKEEQGWLSNSDGSCGWLRACATQGLRANLLRMYNTLSEESVAQCKAQAKYQKLLFALTYFHRCAIVCVHAHVCALLSLTCAGCLTRVWRRMGWRDGG